MRGDKCNCSVFYKNTGDELELVAGGCCKVPVRLKIEKGDDNPVRVEFISPLEYGRLLEMKEEKPFEWSLPDYRAATKRFYYPENRFGTYAHEIGHMLGLPDQYPWQRGGKTSALPGILEIDSGSVMGSRKDGGKVPKEFVEYPKFIKEWITGNVDPSMEPKDK